MNEVDAPMSNTELRLTFADIKSEQAELKRVLIEVHTQTKKTNGRVNWLEKLAYITMGALPILTFMGIFLWGQVFEIRNTLGGTVRSALQEVISNSVPYGE